jgi:plastocyanin
MLDRVLLSLGLGAFLLISFSAAPLPVSADVQHTTIIALSNTQFVPSVAVINVGETVTWTNYDQVQHTVTSATNGYNVTSPLLPTDGKFSVTFDKAGVFTYYCTVHPSMIGRIYVGVAPPPQSVAILNPSGSPGLTLLMNKASGGGISLTASLSDIPQSQAAGVPISFFARYADNSSTYWVKLDTRPTGSNGSAQLTLPRAGAVTGFQAYTSQVGNIPAAYSNVVEFGAPGSSAAAGTPGLPVILLAAVVGVSLTFFLRRRSRN